MYTYTLGYNDGRYGNGCILNSGWNALEILDYVNGFINGQLHRTRQYLTNFD